MHQYIKITYKIYSKTHSRPAVLLYDESYGKLMEEVIPEAARAYTHILVGAKQSAQTKL